MNRISIARRPPVVRLLLPLALLTGCGTESDQPSAPMAVRADSAGVEIVTTTTPATDLPVFAGADSTPSLRLGALNGAPEEQFGRIYDLLPLPDGGVAVLDGQAAEVRLFAEDGTYRSTLGKRGEGPGEFQDPAALGLLAGDTLAVYDRRTMRITRFAPDGTLAEVITLVPDGIPLISRAAFLPDGGMVGQSRWVANGATTFNLPPEGKNVFSLDSAAFVAFARDGTVSDTLAVTPSYENIRKMSRSSNAISIFMRSTAFGHHAYFASGVSGIWMGYNDHFELEQHDPGDGHLVRIVRAPGLSRPRTADMQQAIYDHEVEESQGRPEDLRDVDEWMDLSPKPDTVPAFDRLVSDDEGRVWARAWSGTDPSSRWWVFSPTGDLLGSVSFARGITLFAVRCGQAWGVEQDELDVSYVVRYRLTGLPDAGDGACGGA